MSATSKPPNIPYVRLRSHKSEGVRIEGNRKNEDRCEGVGAWHGVVPKVADGGRECGRRAAGGWLISNLLANASSVGEGM